MRKLSGPFDQVSWNGKLYAKDTSGLVEVPDEAVSHLLELGMKIGAAPAAVLQPKDDVVLPPAKKNRKG